MPIELNASQHQTVYDYFFDVNGPKQIFFSLELTPTEAQKSLPEKVDIIMDAYLKDIQGQMGTDYKRYGYKVCDCLDSKQVSITYTNGTNFVTVHVTILNDKFVYEDLNYSFDKPLDEGLVVFEL